MLLRLASIALGFTIGGVALAADDRPERPSAKTSSKAASQKACYAIGATWGKNLRADGIRPDMDALVRGIQDALDNKVSMKPAEVQQALQMLSKQLAAEREERAKVEGPKNKKEGEAFLTANKQEEGVKVTKSGLQYKVLKAGKVKKPTLDDIVSVDYRGTLLDGTEFDSSYERGEPATFPVDGVIPGWTEALLLMNEGAKWQLFIPSKLAYGEPGYGADIGPNCTLIFEVELREIKSPAKNSLPTLEEVQDDPQPKSKRPAVRPKTAE